MRTQTTPKILVPLEVSAASEAALGHAVAIATATGSGLILFHVVKTAESLAAVGDGDGVDLAVARAGERAWTAQATHVLAALARRLEHVGVVAETEIIAAPDVAAAVVERARRDGAITMIAMALRNATTLRYRPITSVAEAVVRHATVPVLLVRSTDPARPFVAAAPLTTIVVPLDGTAFAEHALAAARAIAPAMHATLLLVAAMPVADGRDLDADKNEPLAMGGEPAEEARRLSSYLDQVAAELRDHDLSVQTQLRTGDPADVIVELAGTRHADLLVMTTHGHSGPTQVQLGSVTRAVARVARQPLLLVGPETGTPAAERRNLQQRNAPGLPSERS